MKEPNVINFLSALRSAVPNAEEVFTQGNCYKLFDVLRTVWPDAEPYYDIVEGHVVTVINNKQYDIRGRVYYKDAIPLANEPNIARKAHRWSYKMKDIP